MKYAIIDENKRVHDVSYADEHTRVSFPAGFMLVAAQGFEPDPMRNYADYRYDGHDFVLDPLSDLPPTLEELVAQKVAEALAAQSE